ncbi:MAG: hypothetical protein AAGE86_13915 [Pseudomonadota bacterium]
MNANDWEAGRQDTRPRKKPGTKAGLEKFGRGCLKGTIGYAARPNFVQVRKAHCLLLKIEQTPPNLTVLWRYLQNLLRNLRTLFKK